MRINIGSNARIQPYAFKMGGELNARNQIHFKLGRRVNRHSLDKEDFRNDY